MRTLALLLLALVVPSAGCGRAVNEGDCRRIGDSLRRVWATEANRAALEDGFTPESAALVIQNEGDRLVADWSVECKDSMQGRRVSERELDCLLRAKTIDQITRCSDR